MSRENLDTARSAGSIPFSDSTSTLSERQLSVFDKLYMGIPRTPETTRKGELWQVPAVQATEEEQVTGPPPPPPLVPPATTTSTTSISSTKAPLPTPSTAGSTRSKKSKYQHNVLSNSKTIYGLKRSSIASRGLPVPHGPPTPDHLYLMPNNRENMQERAYVKSSRLKDNPAETFSHQIMQTFFKAPKARNRGYGMPRPDTREGSATGHLMMHLSQKPSFVRVPSHVSLCQPVRCPHHRAMTEEYCEILGPGCCSSCIETTNRHIAEEIQRRLFPEIEITQDCLVVPALTKVMKEGHVRTLRRRRLNELRRSDPGYPPHHRSRQPRLNSKSLLVWGAKAGGFTHKPLPPVRQRSSAESVSSES